MLDFFPMHLNSTTLECWMLNRLQHWETVLVEPTLAKAGGKHSKLWCIGDFYEESFELKSWEVWPLCSQNKPTWILVVFLNRPKKWNLSSFSDFFSYLTLSIIRVLIKKKSYVLFVKLYLCYLDKHLWQCQWYYCRFRLNCSVISLLFQVLNIKQTSI